MAREEAGLRLAEELSEDRLLVARETLELSVTRQAEREHVLERKTKKVKKCSTFMSYQEK